MADTILQIKHLEKSFGKNLVLKDISFDVSKGEVISIIGSSGSGKSTMLRCINPVSYTHLVPPNATSLIAVPES